MGNGKKIYQYHHSLWETSFATLLFEYLKLIFFLWIIWWNLWKLHGGLGSLNSQVIRINESLFQRVTTSSPAPRIDSLDTYLVLFANPESSWENLRCLYSKPGSQRAHLFPVKSTSASSLLAGCSMKQRSFFCSTCGVTSQPVTCILISRMLRY